MTDSSSPWSCVRLAPLELSDADKICAWNNDPQIRDATMAFRFPVQHEAALEWIARQQAENGKSAVVFSIKNNNATIGILKFSSLDFINRHSNIGLYIGKHQSRGGGRGFVACALAIDYAFNCLNLHRLGLDVLHTNAAAIRLYERLGFTQEGRRRQAYFSNGGYVDVLHYGLLASEWSLIPPPEAQRLCGA